VAPKYVNGGGARLGIDEYLRKKEMAKNTKKKGQRIEIRPAKIKGKMTGFRVVLIGKNGEVLSTSEVLTSAKNVKKNLSAQFNCLTDSKRSNKSILYPFERWYNTQYVDLTGKVVKKGGGK